ncbi:MAG: trypsin-like serine protease [bacterium]|nr:trypsin-like serine protease [bacterium]
MNKKNILFPILALVVLFLMPASKAESGFLDETKKTSPLKSGEDSIVHALQKTYHNIYELYKDSIVFISTEKTVKTRYRHPFMEDPFFREFFGRRTPQKAQKRTLRGLGTGFMISSDGYICTNHHVIAKMDTVTVKVSNKEYKAKVIGSDPLTDIALLKIKGKNSFKAVHFGNSDRVKIGDLAIAIGNPFGLDKTYTTGIISALGRKGLDTLGNVHIQTDTPINQGNSGGPLINIDGEVIGVNRAIYSRSGGSIGLGFAIPINTVRKTLVQLKRYGKVKRGYIGVKIEAYFSPKIARELGLKKPEGALIKAVVRNGPAYKAGLRADDVIIKINKMRIKNYPGLLKTVSKYKIGSTVRVTAWRNRRAVTFKLKIKERP